MKTWNTPKVESLDVKLTECKRNVCCGAFIMVGAAKMIWDGLKYVECPAKDWGKYEWDKCDKFDKFES